LCSQFAFNPNTTPIICVLVGLPNITICGIVPERKQAQTHAYHTLWVSLLIDFLMMLCWYLTGTDVLMM